MTLDATRLRDLAVSESGFVFDPLTGRTFTVNGTGLAILSALKDGRPLESLAQILADDFDVQDGEDVGADVEEFIAQLRQEGVVSS
jgi:PqqD family protein of HPr-rel-A system